MATLDDLFKKGDSLDQETIDDIRAIANTRFDEMCKDGPTDVYLTGFFLDPRTCCDRTRYFELNYF